MLEMKKNKILISNPWTPDRPVSKGATAYHNAVASTSWHKNNISMLIKIIKNKIKKNDIVVDYGAGTGSSAIYLLKKIELSKLLLIDNSSSWLGHAHMLLNSNKKVEFYILDKVNNKYLFLNELIGENSVNHIICANTVHLIPNIPETFKGFYDSMKNSGTLVFQSGNITNKANGGALKIDDSINQIHDLGLELIKTDDKFKKYKNNLGKRIKEQYPQRKLVFPDPRPIEYYLNSLKLAGFKNIKVTHKPIKVSYIDWLNFLNVKRLQAGILPEIGGIDPSEQEEKDRSKIIETAAKKLFKKLQKENKYANSKFFTAEWTYVYAEK